jgi:Holliday junction resolvase RusA-like endonuclease
MNHSLKVKPLSVNLAWQGKRFKTKAYESYEKEVLLLLPKMPKGYVIPEMIKLTFTFGFSNKQADLDNPVKPMMDLLQKKYGFNDCQVYELEVFKKIVPKGMEYINFRISDIFPF